VIVFALLSSVIGGATQSLPVVLPKLFLEFVFTETPPDREAHLSGFDRWMVETSRSMTESLGGGDLDPRLAVMWFIVGLILVISLVAAAARFSNEYLAKSLATLVVRDLRVDLLTRVVRFPLGALTKNRLGDLISRFSTDVQTTFLTINFFVSEILLQPFILMGALAAVLWLSWPLALAALASFPLIALPVIILGRVVNRRSRRTLETLGEATESLNQVLSGLRVVKAYQREDEELARFREVSDRWARRQTRLIKAQAQGKAIMDVAYGVVLSAVLFAGGYLVVEGMWGLKAGDLIGFVVGLATMYRPLRRLSNAYNRWQMSLAAATRVFAVLDSPVEPPDPPGALTIGPIREGIRFRHVSFTYEPATEGAMPVLHDVSFELPAGKTIALVGPSGAGKSTIADLLFRFYEPTSGVITLDGQPLSAIGRQSLLAQVAVVSQHPFLFNASVRQNIAYGRPGATDEDIEAAARAAHIHDDILRLEDGYATLVGERGARLSGGQLQRVTIARAILKDASLLLLDEATSSLDTEAERAVQGALTNLLQDRTALVIAHRLSTVERADHILVLEAGRLVDQGTHEELLRRDGPYRRLYSAQSPLDPSTGPPRRR
jgi:subfamily B ATP-binding cassette protein MsbA